VKYILDIADNANVKIQVKEAHWHVLKEPNSLSMDIQGRSIAKGLSRSGTIQEPANRIVEPRRDMTLWISPLK